MTRLPGPLVFPLPACAARTSAETSSRDAELPRSPGRGFVEQVRRVVETVDRCRTGGQREILLSSNVPALPPTSLPPCRPPHPPPHPPPTSPSLAGAGAGQRRGRCGGVQPAAARGLPAVVRAVRAQLPPAAAAATTTTALAAGRRRRRHAPQGGIRWLAVAAGRR